MDLETNAATENKTVEAKLNEGVNQTAGVQSQLVNDELTKKDDQKKEIKGIEKIQANYDKLYEDYKRITKQLDEEKKKSLSAKEREDLERQEKERENQKLARDLEEKTLAFEKSKFLFDKQLTSKYLDLVAGNSIESFQDNINVLNEEINLIVEKRVNEKLAQANVLPLNSGKQNNDYFSIEEINNLPKTKGAEWMKQNLEKMQKSIQYWNR